MYCQVVDFASDLIICWAFGVCIHIYKAVIFASKENQVEFAI